MTASAASDSAADSEPGRRVPGSVTSIGLFVAFFGIFLVEKTVTLLGYSGTPTHFAVVKWGITATLIAIVLRGEGRTLESIGFRRPNRWDVASALGLTVIGFITLAVTFAIVPLFGFEPPVGYGGTSPTTAVLVTVVLLPLTSGVTEEIWYRGYALERIEECAASTWVAGTVTVVLFVSVHAAFYDIGRVIGIFPLAVVLTLGYIRRRNVYVVIIAHFLINLVGASTAVFMSG